MDSEEASEYVADMEDLCLEDIANGDCDGFLQWYVGDNLDRALKEYENYSA
jgi:hypothetical protein